MDEVEVVSSREVKGMTGEQHASTCPWEGGQQLEKGQDENGMKNLSRHSDQTYVEQVTQLLEHMKFHKHEFLYVNH